MSASASKRKRKEQEGLGMSPKNIADKKASAQRSKSLRTVLVVALTLLVCAAIVFAVIQFVNRPSYDTKATVVTVGTEQISVPVYNYFYVMSANEMNSYYSQYIQSNIPFSQQDNLFGEGTLEDYLKQYTNSTLESVLNVVSKAKADKNFQLSEADEASIAATLSELKADYEQNKSYYPTMSKYFQARYGEGCNLENFEEYLRLVTTYSAYLNKMSEAFKPSAEELEAAYQKDRTNYDTVSYSYVLTEAEATGSTEEPEDGQEEESYTDESKAAARATAESYIKDMPEDSIQTSNNKLYISYLMNDEIAEWLYDDGRKDGDAAVFASNEEEILFYTVRFDHRETNDFFPVNANIITIAKDAEDTELEEGELSAQQKRDGLLSAIEPGMSDEAFAQAAQAQGFSTSVTSVMKSYSVAEIVSFLYDQGRKEGDLLTSFEDDKNYYIVRYSSTQEESYRDQMLRSDMWSDHYTELTSGSELQVNEDMMRYANTDLTFYNGSVS